MSGSPVTNWYHAPAQLHYTMRNENYKEVRAVHMLPKGYQMTARLHCAMRNKKFEI